MEIECAKARHLPYNFRKHPESYNDEKVCIIAFELFQKVLIAEFLRLKDINLGQGVSLKYELLDVALGKLETSAFRFVGYGYYGRYVLSCVKQCLQRAHCKFRGAHIYYSQSASHCLTCYRQILPDGLPLGFPLLSC